MPRAIVVVHSYYLRDTRPRRHAAILARAGWDVHVICARDSGEAAQEAIGGVTIERLRSRRRRGSKLRYIWEYTSFTLLARLAVARDLRRRGRADALIVLGIPNFIVAAAAPARERGARIILDMRDPLPEFFMAKFPIRAGGLLHRFFLWEERWSCARADLVLTVVPSMARLYERSAPRDRIRIMMNAADTRVFKPVEASREPDDRTMLYTGTVAARYGVDLAVRAVAGLADEIPELRLRIVGDGDLVEECRRIARDLRVANRVEFLAPVPVDQVPGLVAEAWLGVQPNRSDPLMEHSLSQKILEWARLGLPVVAGRTAPLLDIFGTDTIWLHEPGDLEDLFRAILAVHRDEDVAARCARAAEAAARVDFRREADALLAAVSGEPAPPR
jgi:glycosyltransferase involved in cell wall biosynthesis